MLKRPKIVYLAIKNRLLHVICTLLSTARGLREVFVFAILQIMSRILKFKLALVTSDNTQVSIFETLSPGICSRNLLTRASVT